MLLLVLTCWCGSVFVLQQSLASESEVKENKVMKPPNTNAVRRARAPRTPTKGSTPSKAATTPGKSRSATKLPLRNNANVS